MVEIEIIEILKKFQKAIEEKGIRVEKIILYDSYTAGKFHKDSDIDVAVISPDFGKDRFEEGVMLFEIAYKIDPRIELVPVSFDSYQKETWIPLIYKIKEKGSIYALIAIGFVVIYKIVGLENVLFYRQANRPL